MGPPYGFSWIDRPLLAAAARPHGVEELRWLREQGLEVLVSLTEDPLRRDWVEDAGLLAVHVPVPDFEAPTGEQFEQIVSNIRAANERRLGVTVHCAAGRGRTGTALAAWFVAGGMTADDAIRLVRTIRPGSIETHGQEESIRDFERRLATRGTNY
jgi:atypical dual specificity phosphatase